MELVKVNPGKAWTRGGGVARGEIPGEGVLDPESTLFQRANSRGEGVLDEGGHAAGSTSWSVGACEQQAACWVATETPLTNSSSMPSVVCPDEVVPFSRIQRPCCGPVPGAAVGLGGPMELGEVHTRIGIGKAEFTIDSRRTGTAAR